VTTNHLTLLLDSSYPEHDIERQIIEEAGGSLAVCDAAVWDEQHVLGQPLLPQAEVILVELAPVTARVLSQAASCVLVARYGVGVDNVDLTAATAAGIWVANVPDYATDTVADHALLLLLAVARELRPFTERVRGGGWRRAGDSWLPLALQGRVLGIVGYGRIGSAVGRRARAMGMEVLAYDPLVSQAEIEKDGAVSTDLGTVLAQCDFLSLHCPLTELTYHLIAKDALEMMKPGVIIVNTARGDVIDLADLGRALDSGHVRGAGLDVFDQEPLPPDHPLRVHPGVIATPHMAFLSDKSVTTLRSRVAENAAAVLQGNPPLYPVNSPAPARVMPPPAPRAGP
jgi:D-3-phosphoglycerate dehydrogenase